MATMSTGAPEQHVSDRVLTVPNALSAARLVGVPVFLWAILTEHDGLALVLLSSPGSPTTSTARSPGGTTWCRGWGSCSTRSPTGSTSLATLLGLAWRDIIPWWLVVVALRRARLFMGVVLLHRRAARLDRAAGALRRQGRDVQPALRVPAAAARRRRQHVGRVARPVGWAFAWWGTGALLGRRRPVRRPAAAAPADASTEHARADDRA